MAESPQVTSPNRTLRLGYRLRWLYLGLVIFGAMAWWAMWPGQELWQAIEVYGSNPVLHAMDIVAFFWSGDTGWFSDDAGLDSVWGWDGYSLRYGPFSLADWLWWAAGGLGIPLSMALCVFGFVGVRQINARRWPARSRLSWGARVCASAIGGLAIGGFVLMVLHLSGALYGWSQAIINSQHAPGYYGTIRREVWQWPPQTIWLLVVSIIPAAAGVWLAVLRREVYWQLERTTRYVGLFAAMLLVVSLVLGLSRVGGWGDYWGLRLELWATVWFSASTALLWAAACRVWLLFRLVKYEKQRVAMMTVSPVCFACEYDLSGSLRGGSTRCPECGVAVPPEVVQRFAAVSQSGSGKKEESD